MAFATVFLAAGCASHASPAVTSPAADKPTATDTATEMPSVTPSSTMKVTLTGAPSGGGATTWVSGMPPGQNGLDAAADQIRPLLQRDYGAWFATVALQQPSGPSDSTPYALMVYRVPHPALDAAVRKALPTIKTVFVDTKLNATQQQALMNSVSFGYWRDRGLQINSLSCDFDGVYTFGVDNPDKWRQALEAEYGKAKVIVVQQAALNDGVGYGTVVTTTSK